MEYYGTLKHNGGSVPSSGAVITGFAGGICGTGVTADESAGTLTIGPGADDSRYVVTFTMRAICSASASSTGFYFDGTTASTSPVISAGVEQTYSGTFTTTLAEDDVVSLRGVFNDGTFTIVKGEFTIFKIS